MSTQMTRSEPDDANEEHDSELAGRLAILEAENERLRTEYARAQKSQYRRTALALLVVGALALGGGMVFPTSQTILFALGGTGVFVGVLTYYLTPEQFVAANVGENVYTTLAGNGEALNGELGLSDTTVYVPRASASDEDVRLFVPQHTTYEIPDDAKLTSLFVVSDDRTRGLALEPTGAALFEEFEQGLTGNLADDPRLLADQLTEGLVEQFELARGIESDVDASGGRLSAAVSNSAYGPVNRFDHPIASFLGVGVARALGRPITVEAERNSDGEDLVTCRWDTEETVEDDGEN